MSRRGSRHLFVAHYQVPVRWREQSLLDLSTILFNTKCLISSLPISILGIKMQQQQQSSCWQGLEENWEIPTYPEWQPQQTNHVPYSSTFGLDGMYIGPQDHYRYFVHERLHFMPQQRGPRLPGIYGGAPTTARTSVVAAHNRAESLNNNGPNVSRGNHTQNNHHPVIHRLSNHQLNQLILQSQNLALATKKAMLIDLLPSSIVYNQARSLALISSPYKRSTPGEYEELLGELCAEFQNWRNQAIKERLTAYGIVLPSGTLNAQLSKALATAIVDTIEKASLIASAAAEEERPLYSFVDEDPKKIRELPNRSIREKPRTNYSIYDPTRLNSAVPVRPLIEEEPSREQLLEEERHKIRKWQPSRLRRKLRLDHTIDKPVGTDKNELVELLAVAIVDSAEQFDLIEKTALSVLEDE